MSQTKSIRSWKVPAIGIRTRERMASTIPANPASLAERSSNRSNPPQNFPQRLHQASCAVSESGGSTRSLPLCPIERLRSPIPPSIGNRRFENPPHECPEMHRLRVKPEIARRGR